MGAKMGAGGNPADTARLNLTLRQLDYFVTVAREGHFRRAAERLRMSQLPLTQRIQAMEHDLGVQLFTRLGNRIELTAAGHLVLAEAEATLAQAGRIEEVARRAENGEAGHLRISIVCSVPFIPAFALATKAFQRDYPGVTLDLVHRRPAQGIKELSEGGLDICLTRRGPVLQSGIQHMTIARDRLMLVLPADHPAAGTDKVSLRRVADERFIVSPRDGKSILNAMMLDLWARAEVTPRIALEADSPVSMLSLVSTGFGNTVLPSLLGGIQMPNVAWKPIDVDEQWTASSIVMLWLEDGPNERVQRRYIEYIRNFSNEAAGQDRAAACAY
jgi:DNA-binding transcriptional LysR family regulator